MILSGENTEEYREKKDYWIDRLCDFEKCLNENSYSHFKTFDTVTFKNGYQKNAPEMVVEFKGIDIGEAKPEWSDNWQGDVFIIKLGSILSTKNIKF